MAATEGGSPFDGTLDDYFAVLGEKHRDAVVEILADEDRSVHLLALAERVAAETRDVSLDDLTPKEVQRVELSLHHNHLPKLDEAGIVEYASEEKRISPADDIGAVSDLVEAEDPLSAF
ncbi:DUF7344 domain-containing protein [Halopelagius fulvigenes]|uniref:DUF7344 domain-containing protein n=1 Tax=Halopelagius fulvigenes TaxID=1198324 RepID=A0ABD5TXT7_9EURY